MTDHERHSTIALQNLGKCFRMKDAPVNWGVMNGYEVFGDGGYYCVGRRLVSPGELEHYWELIPSNVPV